MDGCLRSKAVERSLSSDLATALRHAGGGVLAIDFGVAPSAYLTPYLLRERGHRAQHHDRLESGESHDRTQYNKARCATATDARLT